MAYKIKVDPEKCIGCDLCCSISPKSFEMQGDKAVPKREIIDELNNNEKESEESCPTQAILIEEITATDKK